MKGDFILFIVIWCWGWLEIF